MDLLSCNSAAKFLELLETFGVSQHVNVSTYVSSHILDLIITRSSDSLFFGPVDSTLMLSDNLFVECLPHFPSPSFSMKTISFRKLKDIDIDEYASKYKGVKWFKFLKLFLFL